MARLLPFARGLASSTTSLLSGAVNLRSFSGVASAGARLGVRRVPCVVRIDTPGHRFLSSKRSDKGTDGLDTPGMEGISMETLAEAIQDGRLMMDPSEEDEKDKGLLPDTEGTVMERLAAGLLLSKEAMEEGKVPAGLNICEASLRRAYREGTTEDEGLVEVLAQGHMIAGTIRQRMGAWEYAPNSTFAVMAFDAAPTKHKPALVHFESAVRVCPASAAADPCFHYGLAACQAVLGKLPEALQSFSACSMIVMETEEANDQLDWMKVLLPINIGQTLIRMARPREALDCFTESMKATQCESISPEAVGEAQASIHYFSAVAQAAMDQHGEACREWANFESLKDKATDELLENDWSSRYPQHYSRSLLLATTSLPKNSSEWIDLMDRAGEQTRLMTEREPSLWRGWWMRADYQRLRGDIEGALQSYQNLVRCKDVPGNLPEINFQFGQCLLALGKPIEAAKKFQAEIEACGEKGHSRAALGLVAALCTQAEEGVNQDELIPRADALLQGVLESLQGQSSMEALATKSDAKTIEAILLGLKGVDNKVREAHLLEALELDPQNSRAASLLLEIRSL